MVKHTVMFQFLEEAEGRSARENAAIVKGMLENLRGVIPSLLSLEAVLNDEAADSANYDLLLITEHEDMEGLRAYAEHPEHVKIGRFMKNLHKGRACVDYQFEKAML